MPTPRVIDLSHHNNIPHDLFEAKAAGIIGVIHKLTEGNSYVDDKVQARFHLANEAEMAWGLYHFLRPGDMIEQAEFFISTAQELSVMDSNTLLAADHEDPKVSFASLIKFLEHVEHLTGHSPVIYSGHVLKDQCTDYPDEYRLWLAQYSSSPKLPAGCERYYLWQYTDQGTVPGIAPPTDLNTFEGSDEAFLDQWSGSGEEPQPVPPKPEPTYVPLVHLTVHSSTPITLEIEKSEDVEIIIKE